MIKRQGVAAKKLLPLAVQPHVTGALRESPSPLAGKDGACLRRQIASARSTIHSALNYDSRQLQNNIFCMCLAGNFSSLRRHNFVYPSLLKQLQLSTCIFELQNTLKILEIFEQQCYSIRSSIGYLVIRFDIWKIRIFTCPQYADTNVWYAELLGSTLAFLHFAPILLNMAFTDRCNN